MKHVHQALSHYEVELPQAGHCAGETGTTWRAIKRVGPDGFMSALTFAKLDAARAYATRMSRQETRIVAVEHGGWRRTVDAGEA
jgi:hypothetical protein